MNPEQQRERFTAVSRIEGRLADVETLTEALDGRVVTLATVCEALDNRLVALGQGTANAYDALATRVDGFTGMTCWQRLCWIVRGA